MARVVALAPDLFFASKIEATLSAAGHEVALASTPDQAVGASEGAQLIVVDLHAEGLDARDFAARLSGKPLLGFYSHVEDQVGRGAEAAGFDLVVPRSRMAREMPALVARLLEE
jgi:CheY-like chemotaxis protein